MIDVVRLVYTPDREPLPGILVVDKPDIRALLQCIKSRPITDIRCANRGDYYRYHTERSQNRPAIPLTGVAADITRIAIDLGTRTTQYDGLVTIRLARADAPTVRLMCALVLGKTMEQSRLHSELGAHVPLCDDQLDESMIAPSDDLLQSQARAALEAADGLRHVPDFGLALYSLIGRIDYTLAAQDPPLLAVI